MPKINELFNSTQPKIYNFNSKRLKTLRKVVQNRATQRKFAPPFFVRHQCLYRGQQCLHFFLDQYFWRILLLVPSKTQTETWTGLRPYWARAVSIVVKAFCRSTAGHRSRLIVIIWSVIHDDVNWLFAQIQNTWRPKPSSYSHTHPWSRTETNIATCTYIGPRGCFDGLSKQTTSRNSFTCCSSFHLAFCLHSETRSYGLAIYDLGIL